MVDLCVWLRVCELLSGRDFTLRSYMSSFGGMIAHAAHISNGWRHARDFAYQAPPLFSYIRWNDRGAWGRGYGFSISACIQLSSVNGITDHKSWQNWLCSAIWPSILDFFISDSDVVWSDTTDHFTLSALTLGNKVPIHKQFIPVWHERGNQKCTSQSQWWQLLIGHSSWPPWWRS